MIIHNTPYSSKRLSGVFIFTFFKKHIEFFLIP